MFQVYRIETGRIFTVFATRTKVSEKFVEDDTLFLIYYENKWEWVDAFYYKPVVEEERKYIR